MPVIAKVVVGLALDRAFDYLVPPEMEGTVGVGSPVLVPFGASEKRGYIIGFADHSNFPNLKWLRALEGKKDLIRDPILALARWMAEYYAAPIETAVHTVLPGAVRARGARKLERLMVVPAAPAPDPAQVADLRARAPKLAAALDLLAAEGTLPLQDLARRSGAAAATLRTLERKGYARIELQVTARDPNAGCTLLRTEPLTLMPQQADALALIRTSIATLAPPVVLLHGVTGSGKTEVYLQALQYALDAGRGAIVLVPEIALTPQTVDRFRGRFGDCIAVLHSHLSDGERHDEWHRIHEGLATVAIGARSALFAPVRNLGLIVVDEEHEPTYKQDEAPRYHARDVAVMRGHMEKCAVVLGSATPALESWHNAKIGKYALASLPYRVDHRQMPLMKIVDMRVEAERDGRPSVFSRELLEAIRTRLARAEQTILFLNRRGFAARIMCPKCGHVPVCDSCSVAMVFHKGEATLLCHICGARRPVPSVCPNPECRDPAIRNAGIGTERVEEILRKLVPHARIARMDSDTMTHKDSYRQVLGDFRTGQLDLLVGTQMIAKGLDFPNVTLVGIIQADLTLHMPDFRAGERTFQLLTQVAGRAGRGEIAGEVIVQTYTPFHPAVQAARRLDFEGFSDQELEMRRELFYPPFSHLICVTFRGPDDAATAAAAQQAFEVLQPRLPASVKPSPPGPAPLARAKGLYRHQFILRSTSTRSMTAPLRETLKTFRWPDGLTCTVDVDAQSMV